MTTATESRCSVDASVKVVPRMNSSEQSAAIAAIWERQLPQTRERVQLLQRVARDFSSERSIAPEVQAEALDVAHKLAGSLGMFGYTEATEHARGVEQALETRGMMPQPERLQASVDGLVRALAGSLEE